MTHATAERVVPWAVVCVGDAIRGADGLSYGVSTIKRTGQHLNVWIVPDEITDTSMYQATVRPDAAVTILDRGEAGQVVDLFAERGIVAEVIEIEAELATGERA